MRAPFVIQDQRVSPGQRALIDLALPKLNSHTRLSMPVHVVHGKRDGPRLFVSAAVHGDELNGIEIIRRLLDVKSLNRLAGTLVAVPVVNVYGLIHQSRYLPDRRDLNRSFPGSAQGSLAARVAHLLIDEIVRHCTHGIDLHTGAIHRTNLPQIRANLDDPETERLARAFGVPVLINATVRDGSLREAAAELGIPMLLYEAGEGLRFDEVCIRAGQLGGAQRDALSGHASGLEQAQARGRALHRAIEQLDPGAGERSAAHLGCPRGQGAAGRDARVHQRSLQRKPTPGNSAYAGSRDRPSPDSLGARRRGALPHRPLHRRYA